MNSAIERAREARRTDGSVVPSVLHKMAKEDAGTILTMLESVVGVTEPGGAAHALYAHLTVDELAATIYRHAMIEAGAVIEARSRKPYDICPYCAFRFDS